MLPENLKAKRFFLFQERSKSVRSASQKAVRYPNFGEADHRGLGSLLFHKRSKSVRFASQKAVRYSTSARPLGNLMAYPRKLNVRQVFCFSRNRLRLLVSQTLAKKLTLRYAGVDSSVLEECSQNSLMCVSFCSQANFL